MCVCVCVGGGSALGSSLREEWMCVIPSLFILLLLSLCLPPPSISLSHDPFPLIPSLHLSFSLSLSPLLCLFFLLFCSPSLSLSLPLSPLLCPPSPLFSSSFLSSSPPPPPSLSLSLTLSPSLSLSPALLLSLFL